MAEHRLELKEGTLFDGRYRVVKQFPNGGTSNVYQCFDIKRKKEVVLKILVDVDVSHIYYDNERTAFIQLKHVQNGELYFPICYDYFSKQGHSIFALEKYGPSLYEVLKFYEFKPFKRVAIQQFLRQITKSLIILKQMNFFHSDLKPENVLIDPSIKLLQDADIFINDETSQPKPLKVKLIDFGSLKPADKWDNAVVTTIYYRAPEILMGLRYGREIDIWSLGCMVLELHIGKVPFLTDSHLPHIISIQHMIGKIPPHMLNNCTNEQMCQSIVNGILNPGVLTPEDKQKLYKLEPVYSMFKDDYLMQDLVMKMLQIDPLKRITLEEILKHPFLTSNE